MHVGTFWTRGTSVGSEMYGILFMFGRYPKKTSRGGLLKMFSGGASSTGTISTELVSFPIYHSNNAFTTSPTALHRARLERALTTLYTENKTRYEQTKKVEFLTRHVKMDVCLVVAGRNCCFLVTATAAGSHSRL